MVRWCKVPEIWCMTDVIVISHFGLFLPFYPPTTQKIKILNKWKKHLEISSFYICVPKIMIRWCTVPEMWCMTDVITLHFGPFFALLFPWQPEKSKLKKTWKKTPGDFIILHMYTKNYDQMMYDSWDMVHDKCNYISFWSIFRPFTPLTAQKFKILKKWKKAWRYHHFTYAYHKLWSGDVWFLRYAMWQM